MEKQEQKSKPFIVPIPKELITSAYEHINDYNEEPRYIIDDLGQKKFQKANIIQEKTNIKAGHTEVLIRKVSYHIDPYERKECLDRFEELKHKILIPHPFKCPKNYIKQVKEQPREKINDFGKKILINNLLKQKKICNSKEQVNKINQQISNADTLFRRRVNPNQNQQNHGFDKTLFKKSEQWKEKLELIDKEQQVKLEKNTEIYREQTLDKKKKQQLEHQEKLKLQEQRNAKLEEKKKQKEQEEQLKQLQIQQKNNSIKQQLQKLEEQNQTKQSTSNSHRPQTPSQFKQVADQTFNQKQTVLKQEEVKIETKNKQQSIRSNSQSKKKASTQQKLIFQQQYSEEKKSNTKNSYYEEERKQPSKDKTLIYSEEKKSQDKQKMNKQKQKIDSIIVKIPRVGSAKLTQSSKQQNNECKNRASSAGKNRDNQEPFKKEPLQLSKKYDKIVNNINQRNSIEQQKEINQVKQENKEIPIKQSEITQIEEQSKILNAVNLSQTIESQITVIDQKKKSRFTNKKEINFNLNQSQKSQFTKEEQDIEKINKKTIEDSQFKEQDIVKVNQGLADLNKIQQQSLSQLKSIDSQLVLSKSNMELKDSLITESLLVSQVQEDTNHFQRSQFSQDSVTLSESIVTQNSTKKSRFISLQHQ